MKTYLIVLCLFISTGLASATIQTLANQDKPSRLYVKSYTLAETQSGGYTVDCEDWYSHQPVAGTGNSTGSNINNWEDGSAGSFHETSHIAWQGNIPYVGTGMADEQLTISWPQSWWPNIYGTEIEVINGTFSTNNNVLAPIQEEFCDINISGKWACEIVHCTLPGVGDGLWGPYLEVFDPGTVNWNGIHRRSAQAVLHLQTGGKATSKLRNLFKFVGGAQETSYALDGWWLGNYLTTATTNILPQNITIGSYGALNTNGVLYKILPDNVDVDVTPYVAGADYYSFAVSAQKYHSYFEVFDQQPHPGTTYYSILDETAGHAFWQFKTDAPADALQYISSSLTVYLNHSWGFYPHGADCGLPGQLQNDDSHTKSVKRVFYIGFNDLISGLQFTRGISNAPPEYCIAINGYSCVGAATDAGRSVGITLPTYWNPWNWTPQNFGAAVVLAFPGPLEDDTPR